MGDINGVRSVSLFGEVKGEWWNGLWVTIGSRFLAVSLEVERGSGADRTEDSGVSLFVEMRGMKESSLRRKGRTTWLLILSYSCPRAQRHECRCLLSSLIVLLVLCLALSQRTFSLAGSSFPSKVVEFIKK